MTSFQYAVDNDCPYDIKELMRKFRWHFRGQTPQCKAICIECYKYLLLDYSKKINEALGGNFADVSTVVVSFLFDVEPWLEYS